MYVTDENGGKSNVATLQIIVVEPPSLTLVDADKEIPIDLGSGYTMKKGHGVMQIVTKWTYTMCWIKVSQLNLHLVQQMLLIKGKSQLRAYHSSR